MRVLTIFLLLLCLLAVAQSQSDFPYVSFMGNMLPNHAFVDLGLVGTMENNSVICHTDNSNCCESGQGTDSGDWFFPNETILPLSNSSGPIYQIHLAREIHLRHLEGSTPSGIYRCDISTNTTNSTDSTYVGLYSNGGDITISTDVAFTVNSDLNGPSPQFTLTCNSTGGPATTVTWTRDSTTVSEGNETILDDPVTAQYTHNLTVTGRLGGLYNCTVTNQKPSSASNSFYVEVASAPTNLTAVQDGPTSIAISWIPPTPLGDTTEYEIFYTGANSSGSVTVSATDNSFFSDASGSDTEPMESDLTDNYTLAGLHNGDTYSISVVALSEHFPSDTVMLDSNVSLFPTQPTISITSSTATSISISWVIDSGSVVNSYLVSWERDTSVGCPVEREGNETLSGDTTSYNITGLEEDSSYRITLSAINSAGSVNVSVAEMTLEDAPSASPLPVSVSGITSSNITVQWGTVDCIQTNGNITGYSVRYELVGSGSRENVSVSGSSTSSVILTGLTPSTTYTIEVAAVNVAGVGVYSDPINQITFVEAPVVTVLESSVNSTTIPVAWTSSGSMVDGYVVQWTYDGDCAGVSGGSASVGGDVTNFTIEELEEFSFYSISVNATNSISSAVSNVVSGMTNATVPSVAPSSVNATGSVFNITIQWEMVECIHQNGNITGYSVRYMVLGSNFWVTVSISGGSATTGALAGLNSSTTYTVAVAAVNGAGVGEYSDPLTVSTDSALSVTVDSVNSSSISLRWSVAEGAMVSGYEISYTNTNNTECFNDSGTEFIEEGSAGGYEIESLEEDTEYSITVTLSHDDNGVNDTQTLTAATLDAPPSAGPNNVSVFEVNSSSLVVQWGAVDCADHNGNITGYSVRYQVVGSPNTQRVVLVSGSGTTETMISSLMPSTNYSIEVAAVNSAGTGEYGNSINQLTLVQRPTLMVLQSSVNSTTIPVTWTSAGSMVDGYVVQWTYDGDCAGVSGGSASVGGDVTNFTIEELEEFSLYSISVNVTNSISSAVSNVVSGMTNATVPSAPPTDVNISISGLNIIVQWESVQCIYGNGDITGYIVQYRENGSQLTESFNISVNSTEREETLSGLSTVILYVIQVAAVNRAGVGPYSEPVTLQIPVRTPVLVLESQPDAFTASLSWTSAGSDVDHYVLTWQRDTSVGCPAEDVGNATITDGSTSHTLTGLSGDSSYNATVTAFTMAGVVVSEEVVIQTPEAAPTAAVTMVTVSDVTPTSFSLEWGPVPCIHRNGNITGYLVEYRLQSSGSIQTLNGSVASTTISQLSPDSLYRVEIAGVNSAGAGPRISLVVRTPQTVYLAIGGENLPNHAYVLLNQLGNLTNSTLVCKTDTSTANSNGNWFDPLGAAIANNSNESLYSIENPKGLFLLRGSGVPLEGLYSCTATDNSSTTETVFVGLYSLNNGGVMVNGDINFQLNSHVEPQFTLTCVSTGGPATTVTWTRETDDGILVGDQLTTVTNSTTAEYVHTLNVTGRHGGNYTCNVSNSAPSEDAVTITVTVATAPSDLKVVQESLTSIRVSWKLPNPLGSTTGYRILYHSDGSSSSNASRSLDDARETDFLLSNLLMGTAYNVSLVAISQHLPSEILSQSLQLVPAPNQPMVQVGSVTTTSISLSWTGADSVTESYLVTWISSGRTGTSEVIPATTTAYTITGLQSDTIYTITVTAVNQFGNTSSNPQSQSTDPEPTAITEEEESAGLSGPVVGGAAGGGIFLVIILIFIIIMIVYLLRRRGRNNNIIPVLRSKLTFRSKADDDLHMCEFPVHGKYTQTTVLHNDYINVGRGVDADQDNESDMMKITAFSGPESPEKEAEDDRYVKVADTSQSASKEKEMEGYVQMRPLAVPIRETLDKESLDKDTDADGYISARVLAGPQPGTPEKEADGYVSARVLDGSQPSTPEKEIDGYVSARVLDGSQSSTPEKEIDGYVSARVLDGSQASTPEKEADGYISARVLDDFQPESPVKEGADGYVDARILDSQQQTVGGTRKSLAIDNEYVKMWSQTTSQPAKTNSFETARALSATMPNRKKDTEADGYDTVRTFATLRPSPKPTPKKQPKWEEDDLPEDGYENSRPLATKVPPKCPPKGKVEEEDDDLPDDGYENSRPLATAAPPKLPPKGKVDEDDDDLPEDGYENSRLLPALPPLPPDTEESSYLKLL